MKKKTKPRTESDRASPKDDLEVDVEEEEEEGLNVRFCLCCRHAVLQLVMDLPTDSSTYSEASIALCNVTTDHREFLQ